LLPETPGKEAMTVMDRLRKEIGDTVYSYRLGSVDLMVTISIGISECPRDAKSPEDVLKYADEALYQSKNSGRNRTTVYV
jgi:diguanylate cyclase (GGDEF)-like protein